LGTVTPDHTEVYGGSITGALFYPLPSALPLFATSLAVMGLLSWRRKRKAAAANHF
jgi:hypothetical protein